MSLLVAGLIFVAVSALAAVGEGFAFHGLTPPLAWVALALGALAGGMAWRGTRALNPPAPPLPGEEEAPFERFLKRFTLTEWFVLICFGLFALRAFCWLIWWERDSVRFLSPNNLGDLSLHITYIRYLANGPSFWPDNPIHLASQMRYPMGIDLFNSLLLLVGVELRRGLIWVALLGAAGTAVALWKWGRAFAMAGFLFNGGLAGFKFFTTARLADFQSELAWKSIPLAMFVTQRGWLWAIPAGLVLLSHWRSKFFSDERRHLIPLWVEAALYALMPLFNLHTFIFLSMLLAFWFVIGTREVRVALLKTVGCALIPATWLVAEMTGYFHAGSIIHFKPGWMQDDRNFLLFWVGNFGAFLPLSSYLCWVLYDRRRGRAAAFVWPAMGMFVITCFVMFAPWEWDNTKLMIWSYLIVLPFLWEELISRWAEGFRVAICFVLFFSGFVCLWGGLGGRGYELARRSEIDPLAHALRAFPIEERFAAYPTYNHPLLLCGRKVALGYAGHIHSQGMSYTDELAQLNLLMLGLDNWESAARELKVRYLFWGEREEVDYELSNKPWVGMFQRVAAGPWGEIYDLHSPAAVVPDD